MMTASTAAAYVTDPAPVETPLNVPAPSHIAARGPGVHFQLRGRRQRVLHDINLSVPKGSFVSLIGPSGCGKSTLLTVMAWLIPPSAGEVSVAGMPPQEAG